MTHKNPRRLSEAARCAISIRQDLKKAYPGVKFQVRCQTYSNGDNVNVSYIDGVPCHEVEKLLAKYQYGHFDGMNDMYEQTNLRHDIPQTKYLFVNRDYSESEKKLAMDQLKKQDLAFSARGWVKFDELNTWDHFTAINKFLREKTL